MNFLDKNGLSYLWEWIQKSINRAISYKVDKVNGKGLSTNDYTDEDKEKLDSMDSTYVTLDSIEDQIDIAKQELQDFVKQGRSNWLQDDENSMAYIKNRTHYIDNTWGLLVSERTYKFEQDDEGKISRPIYGWGHRSQEWPDTDTKFRVIFDGVEYIVSYTSAEDDSYFYGDKTFETAPFYLERQVTGTLKEAGLDIHCNAAGIHTFAVYRDGGTHVSTLAEEYLPESIRAGFILARGNFNDFYHITEDQGFSACSLITKEAIVKAINDKRRITIFDVDGECETVCSTKYTDDVLELVTNRYIYTYSANESFRFTKSILKHNNFIITDQVSGLDYIVEMRNGNLVSCSPCVSIEVTTMPTKTSYKSGEDFDPEGMIVTATCVDGSTRTIDNYNCTLYDNGDVSILYQELECEFYTSITVDIESA